MSLNYEVQEGSFAAVPESLLRFHDRFRKGSGFNQGVETLSLYVRLLSVCFDLKDGREQRRCASISVDGTPVVFSHKVSADQSSPSLRFICEPGGVCTSTEQQVRTARQLLNALTAQLGWVSAQRETDEILSHVIPDDPSRMDRWWGGMWLGAVFGDQILEIRVYVNLRDGDFFSRWQRVADLLSPFADPLLVPVVRDWIDSAGRVAIPVGVGMVLTSVGVPVVRIYLGIEHPGMDAIRVARGSGFHCSDSLLAGFCERFQATYGPFGRQSMTVGYDFVRAPERTFRPVIDRFKVDVSFGHLDRTSVPPPEEFICRQVMEAFPSAERSCSDFFENMEACFGGSEVEYFSLGTRDSTLREMTVYARPHGLRQG